MNAIKGLDESLGKYWYNAAREMKMVKVAAELFSLSGDEALWFGVPSVLGSIIFLIRVVLGRRMGCLEETIWDCFGSVATCIFIETCLKWVFRRTRPTYSTQSKVYCVPGEWFSFPSGHSLRAFYVPFWLSRSVFTKLNFFASWRFPRARYFVPWCAAVGWSRIAKGKHYPLDTVAGAIVGSFSGWLIEDYLGGTWRAIMKTISGIFITHFFATTFLLPNVFKGKNSQYFMILYYAFYGLLFVATLPAEWNNIGAQTVLNDNTCSSWF